MKKRGSVSQDVADKVLLRANKCCENCGANIGKAGEIHHIVDWVEAVTDNLIYLCFECHRGTKGCHGRDGAGLRLLLRLQLQDKYYSQGKTEDEVRKLMGGRIYVKKGI